MTQVSDAELGDVNASNVDVFVPSDENRNQNMVLMAKSRFAFACKQRAMYAHMNHKTNHQVEMSSWGL